MAKSKAIKTKLKKDGDFIPPDGGWGWMVVLATGFSTLSAATMIQQFGLLFRDKLAREDIDGQQTTTIINVNVALTSCVGLLNGPMFKTFSYRQVGVFATIMMSFSLVACTFSSKFWSYIVTFSFLYGTFYGINNSSNALALNTYWKDRRRLATSLSWTTTGIGPMVWPYIINALTPSYGENGTILIVAGISFHAVACALLLQPVDWHSKKPPSVDEEKLLPKNKNPQAANEKKIESGYFSQGSKLKNLSSAFSSQYLYNEDDPNNPGYEIIDPGIPMMIRSNDGYFSQSASSRNSRLNSKKSSMVNLADKSSTLYLNESKKNSSANLGSLAHERESSRSRKSSTLYLNESKKNSAANLGALAQDKLKRKPSVSADMQILESDNEECPSLKAPQDLENVEKTTDETGSKENCDSGDKSLANKSILKNPDGNKGIRNNLSYISLKLQDDGEERQYLRNNLSNESFKTRNRRKSNNFSHENDLLKEASVKLEQYLKNNDDDDDKIKTEKMNMMLAKIENNDYDGGNSDEFNKNKTGEIENIEEEEENFTLWQKISLFFDLDLLKDFTFVNLMLGITLANFNEMNFSILTPFILGDFHIPKPDVAFFMSLLAGVDVSVRFLIPFVAGRIGWDNNSFFLLGVIVMAIGRVVLAYNQSYPVLIFVAVIVGFGKGLRTVFMALVIPTHVPLHKLPGASGLQLLTAGIVYMTLGPVVGKIKDTWSTTAMLHCLNIFTWLTAISWGLEKYIRSRRRRATVEVIS